MTRGAALADARGAVAAGAGERDAPDMVRPNPKRIPCPPIPLSSGPLGKTPDHSSRPRLPPARSGGDRRAIVVLAVIPGVHRPRRDHRLRPPRPAGALGVVGTRRRLGARVLHRPEVWRGVGSRAALVVPFQRAFQAAQGPAGSPRRPGRGGPPRTVRLHPLRLPRRRRSPACAASVSRPKSTPR